MTFTYMLFSSKKRNHEIFIQKKFNDQCSSWPGLLLYHFAYKKFFFRVHLSNYTEAPVHDYMYIIAGLLSADFLQYYICINMIFQKNEISIGASIRQSVICLPNSINFFTNTPKTCFLVKLLRSVL